MEHKEYIAAIDLGSSKMVGIIGWKKPNNTLEIIAAEKMDSANCIKRGTIHNIEDTSINIKFLLRNLENAIHPHKLQKIYVGLAGQSIHSLDYKVTHSFGHEEYITERIIDKLIDDCYKYDISETVEVLNVIPNEYKLDARKTEINPVGVGCEEIEANVKLLVGRLALKRNISRAIETNSQIQEIPMPISHISAGSLLLSEADKMLGCSLIDFGAETTTVSVYKGGLLRHLAVIPFGGNVITTDICSVNLLKSDAESLKIKNGSAIYDPEEDNKEFFLENLGQDDVPAIDLHTLNNIIEARLSEIIHNVWAQIELSGLSKSLGCGIYYTGGASQMKDLRKLIKKITGLEAKKCDLFYAITNSSDIPDLLKNPSYSVVLGLAIHETTNCVKFEKIPQVAAVPTELVFEGIEEKLPEIKSIEKDDAKVIKPPKPVSEGRFSKLGKKIKEMSGSLFDSNEDNTADMK